MKIRLNIFFIASILLCAAAISGENNESTEDSNTGESSLYYTAGRTSGRQMPDGTLVKNLSGGVKARHLDAFLEAEEGEYISNPSEIRFYGAASFKDSLRSLFADTLIYHETNLEAFAIGNVTVIESGRLLFADRVRYLKDLRYIEAHGNVVIEDDSTSSSIRGIKAVFNDSTGHGLIIGKPYLRKEEDGSIMTATCADTLEILEEERLIRLWRDVAVTKDSLTMTCADTLEIFENEKIVKLWNNVIAIQGGLETSSERAVFADSTSTLTLTGNPELTYSISETRDEAPSRLSTKSIISGDTINIQIKDRKFIGADVIGSAVSTTISTDTTGTLFDKSLIESKDMSLVTYNDVISRISAEGTARSYYHRNEKKDNMKFVNSASGDTLTFFFAGGKISEMRIFGFGGGLGKGKYYGYEPLETLADSSDSEIREVAKPL
ncbi:MAG: hypothetical protein HOC71_09640 [Candidatus Latescibacteria bacterium]|jgi:hypothetical protein|nr:hypothetical protein [Candidatus Latescibacterota bacterium]